LQEAGYATVGDLAEKMKTHPDDVFRLQGIGPKAMGQIMAFMDTVYVAPIEEVKAAEVAEELPEALVEAAPLAADEPVIAEELISAETVEAVEEALAEERPLEAEAILDIDSAEAVEPELVEEQVEEEPTFDELFALKPELVEPVEFDEEEEEEDIKKGKKGKKKKKKHVEVEYDPDRDMTLVRKKHKRGDGDWDWDV